MKLTVDCDSNGSIFALPQTSALAYLLSKASVTYVASPLELIVCKQHGLTPVQDYPIAAIAASADGLKVGGAYWLRADPVHLVLQRDSFSLTEPCPLSVLRADADAMISSLNQHFEPDGLMFCLGESGAWYLRVEQKLQIKTSLPAMAIGQNVAHYMPQGTTANVWVSYLNEMQMLLHGHAANAARELAGDVVVNSVWLSGGGVMPAPLTTNSAANGCIVGSSAFYRGLAQHCGLMYQHVASSVEHTISQWETRSEIRMQLPQAWLGTEQTFQELLQALQTKKITQLVINLACYEKTLTATINPLDLYKFWRKSKPISAYLV